jgi:peptide/nickel transport system substrate-binding protein
MITQRKFWYRISLLVILLIFFSACQSTTPATPVEDTAEEAPAESVEPTEAVTDEEAPDVEAEEPADEAAEEEPADEAVDEETADEAVEEEATDEAAEEEPADEAADEAAAGQPAPGGTASFAFSSDWGTLDPAATAVTFARNIMQFIYDPLLRKHPETGEVVPGLAESFEVSDDGTVITLNLRQDVTFHDGTPFNAEAVAFSFERITDPELASPMADQISGNVASIETPDDSTVIITLNEPFAPFLDSLTQIALAPVSPTAVEQYGPDFGQNPVGTGPFRFVSTVVDEEVVLARNDDYNWAPDYYDHQGPPYLDELVVLNVVEASTRMALIETGEIDLVYNPLNSQVPSFESDPNFYVHYATRPGVPRVFVLNTEMPPFDDVAVRQAVAWAIDRERILTEAFEDIGDVARGVITPGLLGYWEDGEEQWPGYDLEQAASLLAEAGWEDTDGDGILDKDGEPFQITYGQIPGFPFDVFAQIVVADLASLGIDVSIENEEQAAYLADLRAGKWEMAGMLFPATDPDVLFIIAHSNSIDAAWNTARYSNPEVDSLIEQARTTLDQEQRSELYEQIQMTMLEEMPYIPFYLIQNPYIINARLQGFRSDAQAFLDFYDAYIVE